MSAACLHRLPVGSRAHDDADEWLHRGILRPVGGIAPRSIEQSAQRPEQRPRAAAAGRARSRLGLRRRRSHQLPASSPIERGLARRACLDRRVALRVQPVAPALEAVETRGLERRLLRCATASAARIGAGSISRMSLPMYWRWRRPPPRLRDAPRRAIASRSFSGRSSASSSRVRQRHELSPSSWAPSAARLRALLLGVVESASSSVRRRHAVASAHLLAATILPYVRDRTRDAAASRRPAIPRARALVELVARGGARAGATQARPTPACSRA